MGGGSSEVACDTGKLFVVAPLVMSLLTEIRPRSGAVRDDTYGRRCRHWCRMTTIQARTIDYEGLALVLRPEPTLALLPMHYVFVCRSYILNPISKRIFQTLPTNQVPRWQWRRPLQQWKPYGVLFLHILPLLLYSLAAVAETAIAIIPRDDTANGALLLSICVFARIGVRLCLWKIDSVTVPRVMMAPDRRRHARLLERSKRLLI